MPTYLYETVVTNGATPRRFELRQRIADAPLTADPVTGEPVRRVISGGLGVLTRGEKASVPDSGCGPETCRCGKFD